MTRPHPIDRDLLKDPQTVVARVFAAIYWPIMFGYPSPTIREISITIGWTPTAGGSIHETIKFLINAGLVKRGPARSGRTLTLTEKGRRARLVVRMDLDTAREINRRFLKCDLKWTTKR